MSNTYPNPNDIDLIAHNAPMSNAELIAELERIVAMLESR